MKNKNRWGRKNKDSSLISIILSLLGFGLLMIADSTSVYSNNLYGKPYRFVFLQAAWIIIGLIFFFIFYHTDYKKLAKFSRSLFIFNLIALVFLAIIGVMPCSDSFAIAPCVNGANRWLYINPPPLPQIPFVGILGFQPGELAKLTIVLYLSFQLSLIMEKEISGKEKEDPFKTYMKISVLLSGLIILQPNMSTAVMVFALGTVVYFVSGASLKPLFAVIPVALLAVFIFIVSSPYRMERLKVLISGSDESESSYHSKQALVALGSGGFWGVGFGQSKQKYQYLPEVASDSIFAIIGEEFGFVGTVTVIIAYSFLIYKGFKIAGRSNDLLGKLLASGISSWFGIQFLINIASMTKLIPLTGVPIPLISYGGSSMLFGMIGLGILGNIQKKSELE
ncbi:MAG TPA: putative peptidoglycan glycosyltransferase FtsW [bacterium]|nr:putative peptidoglycan glycosyltransferase FtsW [bacterium]